MTTIIIVSVVIAVVLNLLLLNWIYEIAKSSKEQADELKKHTLLLGEIAEKNGVLGSVILEIKKNKSNNKT